MNRYYRPTRADLGMSLSEFKTWLWRHGVRKDRAVFTRWNCDFYRGNRRFRLRYRTTITMPDIEHLQQVDGLITAVVDFSDLDFDRWANSTEETLTLTQFMERYA